MKNLANCKPSEFLKQTNRIRKAVQKWLDLTDIMKIATTKAKLTPFRDNMTDEEKAELFAENRKLTEAQLRENTTRILDEVMERHADETLVILALCCFIEPEEVDEHSIDEYLSAFTELMNNKAVFDFFTSLMRLEQMSTTSASSR